MRELILGMSMSLDGFVSGPEGQVEWVFDGDPEAIAWKLEIMWDTGLHVMGGRTFNVMAAFWPTSTLVFAPPMNLIPKAVFTRRGRAVPGAGGTATGSGGGQADAESPPAGQLQPGWESWGEAQVCGGELAGEVARLKAQDGGPIRAHGGAGFARSLLAEGLVDRLILLVHPVALGKGLPIFSDLAAPRRLALVSSRAFPRGSVAQVYRPA